jgi:RsgA GTPase
MGLQPLLNALVGKVSVFAGPSGVGKSSILNALKQNETVVDAWVDTVLDAAAEGSADRQHADAAEPGYREARNGGGPLHIGPDSTAAAADSSAAANDAAATANATKSGSRVAWSAFGSNRPSAASRRESSDSNGSSRGDEVEQLQVGAMLPAVAACEMVFKWPAITHACSTVALPLQAIGSISAIGRGKHTTRTVTLLPLRSGGLIADTPGFNQPALEEVTANVLPGCFPEVVAALQEGR